MSNYREDNIPLSRLLLDPNNYRYHDSVDFVYADSTRFHEDTVQDRAFRRLKSEETLLQLKNSFLTNGFIPIERLVVRPYDHKENTFLVLEGNRRLAALKWIAEDHAAGVTVSQPLMNTLEAIPVIVIENSADAAFYESLMGVRHVSGIRQWGGYQRAKLIVVLRDDYKLSSSEVADRLGLSATEVNRRYRAFKALQQMQTNSDFGGYTRSNMYPLFHEAVSIPVVRDEWLDWDEFAGQFKNEEQLEQFYQLITPYEDEDTGQIQDPKITTYAQVRDLRDVIPNPEAKRLLLDPSRSFFDAVSVARRKELSRSWTTQVAEAIAALQSISVFDLPKLDQSDLKELETIRDVANHLIDTYRKLTA